MFAFTSVAKSLAPSVDYDEYGIVLVQPILKRNPLCTCETLAMPCVCDVGFYKGFYNGFSLFSKESCFFLSKSTTFFDCVKAIMTTPAILVCYSMGSPGWFSYWVKLLTVENRGDPCITLNFLISLTFFHFSPFRFPCF